MYQLIFLLLLNGLLIFGSSVKCIDEVFAVAVGCGEKTKPIALGIEAYFIGC